MKINQKKGISLIVLVITIIVMIILAAAIILALNGSGIIGRSNEATLKNDLKVMEEELSVKIAEAILRGTPNEFEGWKAEDVIETAKKYPGKYKILNRKLVDVAITDADLTLVSEYVDGAYVATITATNESVQVKYKVNEGEFIDIKSGEKITGLNVGDKVTGVLVYENQEIAIKEITVEASLESMVMISAGYSTSLNGMCMNIKVYKENASGFKYRINGGQWIKQSQYDYYENPTETTGLVRTGDKVEIILIKDGVESNIVERIVKTEYEEEICGVYDSQNNFLFYAGHLLDDYDYENYMSLIELELRGGDPYGAKLDEYKDADKLIISGYTNLTGYMMLFGMYFSEVKIAEGVKTVSAYVFTGHYGIRVLHIPSSMVSFNFEGQGEGVASTLVIDSYSVAQYAGEHEEDVYNGLVNSSTLYINNKITDISSYIKKYFDVAENQDKPGYTKYVRNDIW